MVTFLLNFFLSWYRPTVYAHAFHWQLKEIQSLVCPTAVPVIWCYGTVMNT